ncbi:MAG: glycoside hydrolase family 32 protein [Bacteroidetes bacterium]|nr:glycoside hydrolase family 32 protein [Bacteroidota bacterium]
MPKFASCNLSLVLVAFTTIVISCQNNQTDNTSNDDMLVSTYYQEQHRNQIHFSPEKQWMNDPNGMVYYEGEYHLFYQFYPDSNVWGPMHWGHAVSRDLVHWEHLPIALYPDELGYIFSGSAVIDWNNTTGFGEKGNPPMIAIYTYHLMEGEKAGRDDYQTQGIAYSLDKGRTWTTYEGNPVIPNPGIKDFRDPKVFWHEETSQWIMIFASADRVQIYQSPNLKEWTQASEFGKDQGSHGGVWECPDLFKLPVDGKEKWVMIVSLGRGGPNGGSGTMYFIGDFDGKTFTNDNSPETVLWLDPGRDNYAGVTWSDIPKEDGRRIFIGWMSNWVYATVVPTYIWRSAMTLPRTLSLKNTDEGIRLISRPVEDITVLRSELKTIEEVSINSQIDITAQTGFDGKPKELIFEFEYNPEAKADFGIKLHNQLGQEVKIGYNPANEEFFVDRTNSGKKDFSDDFATYDKANFKAEGKLKIHVFVDVASVEIFVNDGELVMTEIFFPDEDFNQLSLFGKRAKLTQGNVYSLQSIW